MANNMVEFRWHGRGGQGAKTACLFLAEAAFNSGKDVQGFPEYGPGENGRSYNSIQQDRRHSLQSTFEYLLSRLCGSRR